MQPFRTVLGNASVSENPIREKSPSRGIALAIFPRGCREIRGTRYKLADHTDVRSASNLLNEIRLSLRWKRTDER